MAEREQYEEKRGLDEQGVQTHLEQDSLGVADLPPVGEDVFENLALGMAAARHPSRIPKIIGAIGSLFKSKGQ